MSDCNIPTDLMPSDPLMQWTWISALHVAARNPDMLRQFYNDTGIVYVKPASAVDRMIDESSGRNKEIFESFVRWFNENIWGDLNLVAGEPSP